MLCRQTSNFLPISPESISGDLQEESPETCLSRGIPVILLFPTGKRLYLPLTPLTSKILHNWLKFNDKVCRHGCRHLPTDSICPRWPDEQNLDSSEQVE